VKPENSMAPALAPSTTTTTNNNHHHHNHNSNSPKSISWASVAKSSPKVVAKENEEEANKSIQIQALLANKSGSSEQANLAPGNKPSYSSATSVVTSSKASNASTNSKASTANQTLNSSSQTSSSKNHNNNQNHSSGSKDNTLEKGKPLPKPTVTREGKAPTKSLKPYNLKSFSIPNFAHFFVIKSYSEQDIHKSIKYNIWASTDQGNRRLDKAYRETASQGPIYLYFSANSSGHFQGMAEMVTMVDYSSSCDVWEQDKWKGKFEVKWHIIKDLPNILFRHIRIETNENKPVTNSRDTQEIPLDQGKEVLKIFIDYPYYSSILDDFEFYDKKEMEKPAKKEQSSDE